MTAGFLNSGLWCLDCYLFGKWVGAEDMLGRLTSVELLQMYAGLIAVGLTLGMLGAFSR